ncbi:hypothetical protein [Thiolapillus sp.]
MRKTAVLLLLAGLSVLQPAQAFFCFRFGLGSHGGAHSGPPRYPNLPGAFPAAPHPSWYLRNPPPPLPYSPPPASTVPKDTQPAIPTPQPGM